MEVFVVVEYFCPGSVYIDHIWRIFWLPFRSNGQECEKIPGRCYARSNKMFPNMVNILTIKTRLLYIYLSL